MKLKGHPYCQSCTILVGSYHHERELYTIDEMRVCHVCRERIERGVALQSEDKTFHTKSHRCIAEGCVKTVHKRYLMCPAHWKLVPSQVQHQVYTTYRAGQEYDLDVSPQYTAAMQQAIAAVREKERQIHARRTHG